MPSKNEMNRRKRKQRYLDAGKFGSVATKSCRVDGVSDDGRVLNVNSPGVSLGDGILDSVSMVDGVELHSQNVLVECGSSVLDSMVEGTNGSVLMVDGSEKRGSLVDGKGSNSMDDGSLDRVSLVDGKGSDNLDDGCLNRDSFIVDRGSEHFVDGCLVENSFDVLLENSVKDFDESVASDISKSEISSIFSSSFSRSISPVSSLFAKRGRPSKNKRSSGRKKKTDVENSGNVLQSDNHNFEWPNANINFVPAFLSIDLLDVPFGPMPNVDNRIFTDDIVFSRPEIISLWSDPNVWLQDSFVFIYLKFLSYRSNLNVVVVSPQFAVVDYHFGQGVDPLNIFDHCYNYNQDYDILFIPIVFPGHFGLVIFDRSDRDNFSCIFVDSLPSVNRLTDVSCGVFDQRRVDLIKRCICDLTPGLFVENINIQVLPRSQFTEQRDGINCGFYVCLYSELFLFNNKSLIIPNLNIQYERKRILWHLSQLILSNDFDYVGIFDYNPITAQVNENVFDFNLDLGTDFHDNCVVNNFPIVDMEPDPPRNLRRSERIKTMKNDLVSEITVESINLHSLYEISSYCKRNHKDVPCADVRAEHVVSFLRFW
uniref:Ubiquitin-like protease family profile domain-containing protein n=1 Tax=Meloidogyne enterolobii TaxID=390850 RepID=A0A6V7XHK8_MELEN|nr:unnamed protein product [Meloidogyne enterolobii]